MSQYSHANIKFCGSHAGVSIGEDGSSQMGLEDIAIFRTLLDSVVFYPSDAVSTEKLVEEMAKHKGISYLRTTRKETPILYRNDEVFRIGGSKILKSNKADVAAVIAAGITVHEALKAYEELKAAGILIRVIDLYSVKPVDISTLTQAASDTGAIITVEDHFAEGGIGEAVASALASRLSPVYSLAVRKMPKSGKPAELLDYEEISKQAIMNKVKEIVKVRKVSLGGK
jgi:transketolase